MKLLSHCGAHSRALSLVSFLTALLLLIAVGCGGNSSHNNNSGNNGSVPGSSNPGNNGGTGSSGATLQTPKFVYALNSVAIATPEVAGFRIDPSTGVLTKTSDSPTNNKNQLSGMAATPSTGFVFVADWPAGTITTFRADANSGALTQVSTQSVAPNQGYLELLTDAAGKYLFVSNTGPLKPQLMVFSIDGSGNLTAVGSPMTFTVPLVSLSTDATGKFLFASADNQLYGFRIGSDGSLTPIPGSPITVRAPFENPDKGPTNVVPAVDPQDRWLFASDTTNTVLYVYSLAGDGTATPVVGSPFQIGAVGGPTAVDPTGHSVFTGSGPQVAALSINQTTGALTPAPGSPFDNGPFRSGGAPIADAKTDPSGKFVLFSDSEETKITVFSIDQSTGALTNVPGSPFLTAPQPVGGGAPTVLAITH